MKKLFLLVLVPLLGCMGGGVQPLPGNVVKALSESELEVLIEIRVIPRIGLFNEFEYRKDEPNSLEDDARPKWDKKKYIKAIEPTLEALYPKKWDMLLTGDDSGYKDRRVLVTVKSNKQILSRCEVKAGGKHAEISTTQGVCEFELNVGNAESVLETSLYFNQNNFSPLHISETIPKDFLIVSIGDSFGSGEGNPDSPLGLYKSNGEDNGSVVWMDERCHRSAWSGSIRAGMELANTEIQEKKYNKDGKRIHITKQGAYTIANFACSGATIPKGVVGPYDGRIQLKDLQRKDLRVGSKFKRFFIARKPLDPQIEQVKGFLESAKAFDETKIIDSLIISIGGNDIYFADLLTAMILENLDKSEDKNDLKDLVAKELKKLDGDGGFRGISNQLVFCGETACQQGGSGNALKVRQVVKTQYPDPTRKAMQGDQSVYCDGSPSKGLVGVLLSLFGKEISSDESKAAKNYIVDPLNAKIAEISENSNWKYVVHNDAEIASHGWCRRRSGDPYADSNSWFRDIDDTTKFQGDIYGAMHPSWQGHESYKMLITNAVKEGRDSKFGFDQGPFDNIQGQYYRPPLKVCVEWAEKERRTVGPVKFIVDSALQTSDELGCLKNVEKNGNFIVLAQDPISKKWINKEFRGLKADSTPPALTCQIRSGDKKLNCHSDVWLSDAKTALHFFAFDAASGMHVMQWEVRDGKDKNTDKPREAQSSPDALKLSSFREGITTLQVDAIDKVGNVRSSEVTLRIDATPPKIHKITAWDADITDFYEEITLPRIGKHGVPIRIDVQESHSGLLRKKHDQMLKIHEKDRFGLWPVTLLISPSQKKIKPIFFVDEAGNQAEPFTFSALPYQENNHGVVRVEEWKRNLEGKFNTKISKRALKLGAVFPTDDDLNTPAWILFGAWLNLADGRVKADFAVDLTVNDMCRSSEGAAIKGTLYKALMLAKKCLHVADAGEAEKSIARDVELALFPN